MPFVIYIFTLSAFALGLAEFVPIGLADVMANSLGVDVEQTGATVTAYALGATVAAPILTALTMGWSRKSVMLTTALVFSAGSLAAALADSLTLILGARFIAGVGHGLFLAVASSTAARLAGPSRAGSAVAVVFGGFTLAMAIGVPISTYLGGMLPWRVILGAIAVFGAIGFLGLLFGMRDPLPAIKDGHGGSALHSLQALLNGKLLAGALVTVLGYAGSFAAYTYIAPLLTEVTGSSASTVGVFMLVYGVMAAIGNILGGKLTDAIGVDRASMLLIAGIVLVVFGMWAMSGSLLSMGVLVALLGMFTFAAVPALQARLIGIAERHAPHAHGVAAGLNIAGFNSGIALGSVLGGMTIGSFGLAYVGIAGALVSGLGLALILAQMLKTASSPHQAAESPAS